MTDDEIEDNEIKLDKKVYNPRLGGEPQKRAFTAEDDEGLRRVTSQKVSDRPETREMTHEITEGYRSGEGLPLKSSASEQVRAQGRSFLQDLRDSELAQRIGRAKTGAWLGTQRRAQETVAKIQGPTLYYEEKIKKEHPHIAYAIGLKEKGKFVEPPKVVSEKQMIASELEKYRKYRSEPREKGKLGKAIGAKIGSTWDDMFGAKGADARAKAKAKKMEQERDEAYHKAYIAEKKAAYRSLTARVPRGQQPRSRETIRAETAQIRARERLLQAEMRDKRLEMRSGMNMPVTEKEEAEGGGYPDGSMSMFDMGTPITHQQQEQRGGGWKMDLTPLDMYSRPSKGRGRPRNEGYGLPNMDDFMGSPGRGRPHKQREARMPSFGDINPAILGGGTPKKRHKKTRITRRKTKKTKKPVRRRKK